jgi:flagellar assembly protein FliH
LESILEDLSASKSRVCTEAEGQLLELTLALAEAVVRHEVSCQAETVHATLQAALKMAAEHSRLKVLIHPDDLEDIKQFIPQVEQRFGAASRLELQGDPSISQGGCLVETDSGFVDARLEEQLETLREQLHRTWMRRHQEAANSMQRPSDNYDLDEDRVTSIEES